MGRIELNIYYRSGNATRLRTSVNKWKFQDTMMGEQYVMFNVTSEHPIDWAVGDFCTFRGETYTLNYVPSVTQKARTGERKDAFTYENVKMESRQEELTRCIMLDITPTTGEYVPALGTNYTGSSRFPLYCGETTVNGRTLTAVCALAAKIQANLDRLYPSAGWSVVVDTESTYTDSAGNTVLVTHTEDKELRFDNTSVAQALAEVHNTFNLNYSVRGRIIYIGYSLNDLTSDDQDETFAFGYGRGYPTKDDSGKALFQIKRISNSQQKVVTRLRALGSTKNMPYRYYNKKYDLSQALFPTNLQLPDTFIPEGSSDDAAGTNSKWGHNKQRPSYLRAVKGDTNDAFIDKNDDAASCQEGIREDCARWDGSSGDLPEIYPTIEEATFGELRGALVPDQDGQTGQSSFPGYDGAERIDSLLSVGYLSDGTLIDDANTGDGILTETGNPDRGISRETSVPLTTLNYNTRNGGDFTGNGSYYAGIERPLFTIQDVAAGEYSMAPTIGAVKYGYSLSCSRSGITAEVGFRIVVRQTSKATGTTTEIATYVSDFSPAYVDGRISETDLPEIPDVKEGSSAKVNSLTVSELSDITVSFAPTIRNVAAPADFTDNVILAYMIGNSRLDDSVAYLPEYTWVSASGGTDGNGSFHVFIKDMGFDITACWTDETPVVAMKSGRCVGREFEIGENVQKVTYNGKKGYMLTLSRATDSSLNTYYPSETDPIAAGDYFVLLNISMPDAYVKMAEVRLLRAATDYLADNCETKFTYQPQLDHIYLQRNYDNMVAAGTPEKSVFWRLYAGLKFTFRGIPSNADDPLPVADITISQVSISMGEGLTPKVEITLNDDVQQTTIQKLTMSVDRIYNGSLFSSGGAGGSTSANMAALRSLLQTEGNRRYLSKEHDDTAAGKITFEKDTAFRNGLGSTDFSSGELGAGYHMGKYGNTNDSYLEIDRLLVRKMAYFVELAVKRLSHVGGSIMVSPADLTISNVEVLDDVYRCYVDLTDGHSTINISEWEEGDLARCQTYNVTQATYYWRAVENVDYVNGYVDLSITDCDRGSGIPKRGDVLVVVGNKTDSTRQNAIEISSTGSSSPSIKIYHGIDDYSLAEKDATSFEYDPTTGRMKMVVYGDMYVGDRQENNYIKYDQTHGVQIRANAISMKVTEQGQDVYKGIEEIIEEISQQGDGSFIVWRSETDDEPSSESEPESEWTTNDIKDEHIGDIYLNSEGLCWEYKYNPVSGYFWDIVSDQYLIESLRKVREKARCFAGTYGTDTPTSGEYSKNDLWVKATYQTTYTNDLLVCIRNGSWDNFSITDWALAANYSSEIQDALDAINDFKDEVQAQVDGKADSYYQSTDPSESWTDLSTHVGDLWYNTNTKTSSVWGEDEDVTNPLGYKWFESSVDLEPFIHKYDGKASIFYAGKNGTHPTLPYNAHDFWITEDTVTINYQDGAKTYEAGTILVSLATRDENSQYYATDWVDILKYTDGKALQMFINNEYRPFVQDVSEQLDGVAESYITTSSTDPSTNWTSEEKANHKGDIWVQEDTGLSYYWTGARWIQSSISLSELTDKTDGKATIFVSIPNQKRTNADGEIMDDGYMYRVNDIWILETPTAFPVGSETVTYEKGTIMVATTSNNGEPDTFSLAHWVKKDCYTNGMNEDDKEALLDAGIDIVNGKIIATSDSFKFQNRQGTEVAVFEEVGGRGYLRTDMIHADEIVTNKVVARDADGHILSIYNGNGNGTIVYYYPDGSKMKEDVFTYTRDLTTGQDVITGMKTRYYNPDGSLAWELTESGDIGKNLHYYWELLDVCGVTTASTVNALSNVVKQWSAGVPSNLQKRLSQFVADSSDQQMYAYNGLTCYGSYDRETPTSSTVTGNEVTGYMTFELVAQAVGDEEFVDGEGNFLDGYYFGHYTNGYCDNVPDKYFVATNGWVWDNTTTPKQRLV